MPKEQVDLQKISSKELLCEVFVFSVHTFVSNISMQAQFV